MCKTQFQQFYEAFGGYSPGGITYDGVAYIKQSVMDGFESRGFDWRSAVRGLNSIPIVGVDPPSSVEVVPDEKYAELCRKAAVYHKLDV